MELLLNLAWVLMAAALFSLLLHAPPQRGSRQRQFVALVVLLLVLFPVISLTDDLQATQNLAETDCCQRRANGCSVPQSVLPHIASWPLPAVFQLSLGSEFRGPAEFIAVRAAADPALAPIESRPPPTA